MGLRRGTRVFAADDRGRPPKMGVVERLVRREPIRTGYEGVVETRDVYLVRWLMDDVDDLLIEVPAENLREVPVRRHAQRLWAGG